MSHALPAALREGLEADGVARLVPRRPLAVIAGSFGLFILVHLTQYLSMGLASQATGATLADLASGRVRTPATLLIRGAVALVLGIPATILATRYLWRRPAVWMRTRPDGRLFALGCILGLGAVALVVAALAAGGCARISVAPREDGLGALLQLMIALATWALFTAILEEYVFRGMATRELAARWGWPLGALAAGVYFAATHLMSIVPLLTPGLALGILVAGMVAHGLFVALYVRGSSLWLPIGFHAGWNFAVSGVLGTTMSGRSGGGGLLGLELSGPDLVTGGAFGVESSAVAVLAMALLVPGVLFLFRRRGSPLLPPGKR